jgi:serine/threonine protein kinase
MAIFSNGKQLGRYVILNAIGSGGMGEVYRARDRSLGRSVALKILSPELSSSPTLKSRFERQAKIISSLHHPNICSVYDICYEDEIEFLVTEFLEGETLSERLKKGPLPPGEALSVAIEVTDALDSAHQHGIIHRDLKPSNIMLTEAGTKVMDFGLVRALTEPALGGPLTSAGFIVGSIENMSPEQIQGAEFDARSDIFAFGTVLYEMLAGKPAFKGPSAESIAKAILKEDPAPLKIAPGLDRIVRQSLEKIPDRRFQSVGALRNALIEVGDSPGKDKTGGASQPPWHAVEDIPDRRASFWISERGPDSRVPLTKGDSYTGNFRIGSPVPSSLLTDEQARIPNSDVPPEGLQTSWVISSSNIQFESIDASTVVKRNSLATGNMSVRFSLTIPGSGDSKTIQFRLRPLTLGASFIAYVYVRNELYREFHVNLLIEEARSKATEETSSVIMTRDILITAPGHLDLRTTHEWTTPPGEMTLTVSGKNNAAVRGGWGATALEDDYFMNTERSFISGSILNVRKAAEDFRGEYSDDLDDIDPEDLCARLSNPFQPHYDWANLGSYADEKHSKRWQALAMSKELFDFAYEGRQLYDTVFPPGKDLRSWLDKAPPGLRINVIWRPTTGAEWIHVPWGLMYTDDVKPGVPVNPTAFWGLRYRLGYSAYPPGAPSKALGTLQSAWSANFLYSGEDSGDAAANEGKWQKNSWSAWQNQFIVPTGTKPDRRGEIMNELSMPTKVPTSVVYIFCQCSVGSGNMPVLQFGPEGELVRHTELGTSEFGGHPLVFANACVTGASDPLIVNELEKSFFQRKCRAYIGTEARVPISMASRFASVFFHFFYRLIDSKPMPSGEAIAQARLFLWSHYKNIGGLLYTLVNQYDLYMANEAEIVPLRQW